MTKITPNLLCLDETVRQSIRSYVPGRIRMRFSQLVGISGEQIALITNFVQSVEGIRSIVINPRLGSVLLTWDTKVITQSELIGHLQLLQNWLLPVTDAAEKKGEAQKSRRSDADQRLLRRNLNRMMLALSALTFLSVTVLPCGQLHKLTAQTLSVLLAEHIYRRRKAL